MSSLRELQADFAAALFDPERQHPSGLRAFGEPAGAERFAVYRNNVMVALIEALRDAYPVVCRLVGDEFFGAMAAVFARSHPPRSPVMLDYGAGFAEFIAQFAPAASVPYLADVAALERAWVEAYHSAEADQVTDGGPTLHAATRLVRSRFAVLVIWQAHQGEGEPELLELGEERHNVLVTRPEAQVQACRISDEAAEALESFPSGSMLSSSVLVRDLRKLGALMPCENT